MAISYVGQATGITSATLPTHQSGDLIVGFAFRDGSTTAPTVPAGWTTIASASGGGGSTCASALVWRLATSSGTTTGTFTNATAVVFQVYRGAHQTSPIGSNTTQNGSTASVTYPALTLTTTNGSSWVAGFVGHRSTNVTLSAPTGMTNRATYVDATNEAAGHDTNAGVTSWSAQSVAVGGTASNWITRVVEIEEQPLTVTHDAGSSLSGVGTIGAIVALTLGLSLSLSGTLTQSASPTVTIGAQTSLSSTGTLSNTAEYQITNGIRITEDGNRRVTESGLDQRVTQLYSNAFITHDAISSLSGIGSTTSNAIAIRNVGSSLSGSLSVFAEASKTNPATSSLAGTGSVSSSVDVIRQATSSFTGAGTGVYISSLSLNTQASLVGSLATLSASTFTANPVASLSASGTLTNTVTYFKNFIATLSGVGTQSSLLGYRLDGTSSLTGVGTITPSASVTRFATSSLSGSGSQASIASRIVNNTMTLSGSGTISGTAVRIANTTFQGQGTGSLSGTAVVSNGFLATLVATSSMTISPQILKIVTTLAGGAGVLTPNYKYTANARTTLSSTGNLNGIDNMILSGVVTSGTDLRVTESGDRRITDTGDFRATYSSSNMTNSTLTAIPTITAFNGSMFGHREGSYKPLVPYVKYNDVWVIPRVYVKDNGIWKRTY